MAPPPASTSTQLRWLVGARLRLPAQGAEPDAVVGVSAERLVHVQTILRPRTFELDHVFTSADRSADIFAALGQPVVRAVLGGEDGAVLSYGQAGTGKTNTMLGDDGIVPLACEALMSHEPSRALELSFLEVRAEDVRDLMCAAAAKATAATDAAASAFARAPLAAVRLVDGRDGELVPDGLTLMACSTAADVRRFVLAAQARRQLGSHVLIFVRRAASARELGATASQPGAGRSATSARSAFPARRPTLVLADLAGAPPPRSTTASAKLTAPSLSALAAMISRLAQVSDLRHPRRRARAIDGARMDASTPVLLRLLRRVLHGRMRAALLTTLSSYRADLAETLRTLRIAAAARQVDARAIAAAIERGGLGVPSVLSMADVHVDDIIGAGAHGAAAAARGPAAPAAAGLTAARAAPAAPAARHAAHADGADANGTGDGSTGRDLAPPPGRANGRSGRHSGSNGGSARADSLPGGGSGSGAADVPRRARRSGSLSPGGDSPVLKRLNSLKRTPSGSGLASVGPPPGGIALIRTGSGLGLAAAAHGLHVQTREQQAAHAARAESRARDGADEAPSEQGAAAAAAAAAQPPVLADAAVQLCAAQQELLRALTQRRAELESSLAQHDARAAALARVRAQMGACETAARQAVAARAGGAVEAARNGAAGSAGSPAASPAVARAGGSPPDARSHASPRMGSRGRLALAAATERIMHGEVLRGPSAHCEGFLVKQGGVFPTWRRRYVRLEGQMLSYSLSPHSLQPVRALRIGPGSAVHDVAADPGGFRVAPSGVTDRVYYFRAASVEGKQLWMDALRASAGATEMPTTHLSATHAEAACTPSTTTPAATSAIADESPGGASSMPAPSSA